MEPPTKPVEGERGAVPLDTPYVTDGIASDVARNWMQYDDDDEEEEEEELEEEEEGVGVNNSGYSDSDDEMALSRTNKQSKIIEMLREEDDDEDFDTLYNLTIKDPTEPPSSEPQIMLPGMPTPPHPFFHFILGVFERPGSREKAKVNQDLTHKGCVMLGIFFTSSFFCKKNLALSLPAGKRSLRSFLGAKNFHFSCWCGSCVTLRLSDAVTLTSGCFSTHLYRTSW